MKSILLAGLVFLLRAVRMMPENMAASERNGAICGLTNAAASTMADSTNRVVAIRFIMSRFQTSALWFLSSIMYCAPILMSMSAHAT